MKKITAFATIVCLGLAGGVFADSGEHPMAAAQTSKEFIQMKQLVGSWKGTKMGPGNEPEDASAEYQLTAGGSALSEKLLPGTPHEMLDVYADEGGKLAMTHYCMLGNHPHMQLTKADAGELDFVMTKNGGVDVKEPHMHALTLYFQDNDHVMQKWTEYEQGKEKSTVTFKLVRVPNVVAKSEAAKPSAVSDQANDALDTLAGSR
jgi:hypothetical protein